MRRLTAMLLPLAFLTACAGAGPDPYGYPAGPPMGPHTGRGPGGYYEPPGGQPIGPYTGAPAGSYIGPEATFACDDLTTVQVQPGIGSATASMNSGMSVRLPHQGGGWYGMGDFDFRMRGNEAVWTVAGNRPVLCRRK